MNFTLIGVKLTPIRIKMTLRGVKKTPVGMKLTPTAQKSIHPPKPTIIIKTLSSQII